MARAMTMLGDPQGMRQRNSQDWNGRRSLYTLAGGTRVWVTWLSYNRTHCHIHACVDNDGTRTWHIEDVCRLQAAAETEKLLVRLEATGL